MLVIDVLLVGTPAVVVMVADMAEAVMGTLAVVEATLEVEATPEVAGTMEAVVEITIQITVAAMAMQQLQVVTMEVTAVTLGIMLLAVLVAVTTLPVALTVSVVDMMEVPRKDWVGLTNLLAAVETQEQTMVLEMITVINRRKEVLGMMMIPISPKGPDVCLEKKKKKGSTKNIFEG